MKLVIFALLAVSASAFKLQKTKGNSEIIGGDKAAPGEFPYIVDLRYLDYGHYCAGSIYNENWIITAAHCLVSDRISSYTVVAGELNLETKDGHEQSRSVENVTIHERYDYVMGQYFDIGLIRVAEPFVFNEYVNSISLNSNKNQFGYCTIAGWGITDENFENYPNDLHKVVMPIIDDLTCFNTMGSVVSTDNLCAGYAEGGSGSCYADSGGPLVVKDDNDNDLLTGIDSFGPEACGSPNKYSVYTEIAYYIDWIEENTY